jgi:hypothetical protein
MRVYLAWVLRVGVTSRPGGHHVRRERFTGFRRRLVSPAPSTSRSTTRASRG